MASSENNGLGDLGIIGDSRRTGQFVADYDMQRGWQSISPMAATTTITSLDDPPTYAVKLPAEGRNVELRMLGAQTAGTIAVDVYLWPFDPGTTSSSGDGKNATNGNAAGMYLDAAAQVFTTSAKTVTSPSVAASTFYASDSLYIDRRGYGYMAICPTAATTVVVASSVEGEYRVF